MPHACRVRPRPQLETARVSSNVKLKNQEVQIEHHYKQEFNRQLVELTTNGEGGLLLEALARENKLKEEVRHATDAPPFSSAATLSA